MNEMILLNQCGHLEQPHYLHELKCLAMDVYFWMCCITSGKYGELCFIHTHLVANFVTVDHGLVCSLMLLSVARL